MTVKWLDRRVSHPGPYLALCLTESEYLQAMKHCKISNPGPWIKTPQAQATAHHLGNADGELVCVVCVRDWQGREQEAYAIQGIAQELMAEFARRMK